MSGGPGNALARPKHHHSPRSEAGPPANSSPSRSDGLPRASASWLPAPWRSGVRMSSHSSRMAYRIGRLPAG